MIEAENSMIVSLHTSVVGTKEGLTPPPDSVIVDSVGAFLRSVLLGRPTSAFSISVLTVASRSRIYPESSIALFSVLIVFPTSPSESAKTC